MRLPFSILILLLCGVATVAAQTPNRPSAAPAAAPTTAPQPTVGAEPQQTTAIYGDWSLRCVRQAESGPNRRACEVSLSLQMQGQTQTIAQIAVGRPEPAQPLRIVALLPTNISFPSSVRLALDENDQQPVELIWRRCLPGACVADVETTQPLLARLRARTEGARITFKDSTGRDVTLPISLRGFAQALDALNKENPS